MSSLREFHEKIKKLTVSDEQDLNKIIDKLNALDIMDISNESELLVNSLCDIMKLIPSNNDHILSKFCSLISFVVKKLKVKYDASNGLLVQFLSLKLSSCGTWVLSDVLVAFTNLLNYSDQIPIEMVNFLFSEDSVLLNSLTNDIQDKNVQYNSFLCVFALLKNLGESAVPSENLEVCCLKCLLVLKNKPCHAADPLSLKILISCLKILQLIFSSKNASIKNLGEVLGILKSLLFYGLPGQSFLHSSGLIPTLSCPDAAHFQESQSESDASYPKIRNPKKNKRRMKKTHSKSQSEAALSSEKSFNTEDCQIYPSSISHKDIKIKANNSSDDSELSDAECNISKIKGLFSSVRQNSYLTVQTVVMLVDQKSMFGYWTSFLPDHPVMPGMPSSPTIFTTVLKDPAPQVRLNALNLLIEIFRGSKPYLALADERSIKRTAFTSLSSVLASMIIEIHRCLLLTTLAENSPVLLIQILKLYAVLAENVPYVRINKEMLFKFLKHVKVFLYHKDIQVQVACLSVFTSIISSEQTPSELENLMLSSDFDHTINLLISNSLETDFSNYEQLPWIIELCHKNILRENYLSSGIQSLQLLCNFTRKYFHKLRFFSPVLKETVLFCLNNSDFPLQLHGVKLLDLIGRCINNIPDEEFLNGFVSELFLEAATSPLIKCLTNEEHKTLQVAVCDCLSTMPASDFALLHSKCQNLYISILLGLATDSNANVKGASIRCLGIFSLFPCLVQDASFFDNLGTIIVKVANDQSINVRFKASWALGNLSDAIFLNRNAFISNDGISVQFFHSICLACIEYSKDSDRVKANAVRSLGNFLHFIPEHYLDLYFIKEFIKTACEVLLLALSANFMKVCWNACYALKSMMKNEVLIRRNIVNTEDVLNSLVRVLKSPNFKVRLSAVQAISSLTDRKQYGASFPLVWKEILVSLQSSSEDVNFKEIKHQQNLCHQLCHTMCHLIFLMTIQDLSYVENELIVSKEILLVSMWKYGSAVSEENFNATIAVKHLTFLMDSIQDEEYNKILVTLQDIVNQAILAYFQKDKEIGTNLSS